MKTRIGILLASVLFSLALPLAAQTGASAKISGFDAGNFPRVRAFVSVTDAAGRALQSLTRDAFQLSEDSRNAEVVAINASQDPIHVGLVIDHSGSMSEQNKLGDAKTAASAFVDEMRAQDEAFVTMFDNTVSHLQDFTNSHGLLQNAISRINAAGGTNLYDAVAETVLKYEARKGQRKNAIILLSDGLDNREELGGYGSSIGRGSKRTLDEAIAKAKEMQVVVYTIGLGSDADQTRLRKMATETGGRFYYAPRGEQLKELYRLIAEQLQKEYAIDFTSPRAYADGTQRRVQVNIKLPDGSTLAADGMYVAGLLFNRIHADWLIGAALGLILLTVAVTPGILGMIFKPRSVPQPAMSPIPYAPPIAYPPVAPSVAVCPYCGCPLRAGARFCGNCGRTLGAPPVAPPAAYPPVALSAACPRCNNPLRQGAKFCGKCGYRMV